MIKQNLNDIYDQIEKSLSKSGRSINDITVVAATKQQSVETLNDFKENGLIYGENKVQEFIAKYPFIDGVNWHFIGQLQTNKVKYIIDKVELIHSVDRLSLAAEIDRLAKKHNKVQDILLEINVGSEIAKGGVAFEELNALVDGITPMENVRICGLMTVMPIETPSVNLYEKMYNTFVDMKKQYPDLNWKYLSMGMSGDFCEALENGSNMIRLGRILFGERKY